MLRASFRSSSQSLLDLYDDPNAAVSAERLEKVQAQLSQLEGIAAHRHRAKKQVAFAELVKQRTIFCKNLLLQGETYCKQLPLPQVGMRVIDLMGGDDSGVVTADKFDLKDGTTFTIHEDERLVLEEVLMEADPKARYHDRWDLTNEADDVAGVGIIEPPHLTELYHKTLATYAQADARHEAELARLAPLRASVVAACIRVYGLEGPRGWRPLALAAEPRLADGHYGCAIALLDAALLSRPPKRKRKIIEERLSLARQGPRYTAAAAARAAEARTSTALARYDTDHTGSLRLDAFRKLVQELRPAAANDEGRAPPLHRQLVPTPSAKGGGFPAAAGAKHSEGGFVPETSEPPPAEIDEIEEIFNLMDLDGSGALDARELRKALQALGIRIDASSGGSERRGYLVALSELVGHADPRKWREQFRELLLYTAEARGAPPPAFDLNITNDFLVKHYRDEDDCGSTKKLIQKMVAEGWAPDDAEAVCLAYAYCGQGLGRAVRKRDERFAPSCHAVANAIGRRALKSSSVAPIMYAPMHGRPDLGLSFGAADYEPNLVNLEIPDATGARACCCSMSIELRDDNRLTERGCVLRDDDGDPVVCDCDVIGYVSQPNEEHALHNAVLQLEGDGDRCAAASHGDPHPGLSCTMPCVLRRSVNQSRPSLCDLPLPSPSPPRPRLSCHPNAGGTSSRQIAC